MSAATYNSKDVASATTVTFTTTPLSLTGTGNGNYTITAPTQAATITQKGLTVTGTLSVPSSKVYDGTAAAVVSGAAALQGTESAGSGSTSDGKPYSAGLSEFEWDGDAATYNSKDVASATTVTFTTTPLSLTGTGNGNYTITAPTQAATITQKGLTVTGTLSVPSSKVYDGTTAAVVSGAAALLGTESAGSGSTSDGKPYSADSVSLSGSVRAATYNSKDVASATTVTFTRLPCR